MLEESVHYYSNRRFRYHLEEVENFCTRNVLNLVLEEGKIKQYIDNYPPENDEHDVPFEDVSAFIVGMEQFYGLKGGRGIAIRTARAMMNRDIPRLFDGLDGLAWKVLPINAKLRIAVLPIALWLNDALDIRDKYYCDFVDLTWYVDYQHCPFCWGRGEDSIKHDITPCHPVKGIIGEALFRMTGGYEFEVTQTKCKAGGDEVCTFKIKREPIRTPETKQT